MTKEERSGDRVDELASFGVPVEEFRKIYAKGTAPWETGEVQPVVRELFETGKFRGPILDLGCGTGENAVFLAQSGLRVMGVDVVPGALKKAVELTRAADVSVEFQCVSGLDVGQLGHRFQTVLDCAVFHVFGDEDRKRYVEALAQVLDPGGRLFVVVFSEHEPGEHGPRRVSQEELCETFDGDQFEVVSIESAQYMTRVEFGAASCWLAEIVRL